MPNDRPTHTKMLRKLANQSVLTEGDREAICNLPFTIRELQPAGYIVREGEQPTRCAFLVTGFTYRHKITRDGARQIVSFQVPGDFIDLQHLLLRRTDHNVQALTAASIAEIPLSALVELMRTNPNVAQAIWVDALIEASIFREWVVNVGRRDARARLAHLLCEFAVRLHAVGLAADGEYEIPMTQEQLGDALGLTTVHVNRVLRGLEKDGLVQRSRRQVMVRDWNALCRAADFNEVYLHLDQAGLGPNPPRPSDAPKAAKLVQLR